MDKMGRSLKMNVTINYRYLLYCFFQSVAQKSEKIGEEEIKCKHMAELAQHDLDEALPALQEAMSVSTWGIRHYS